MQEQNDIRVGLTLSGGGARGIAHIGAIRALLEAGIRPSVVSGTSAGAIAGVLLCSGMEPDAMLEFVRKTSFFKLLRANLSFSGLIPLNYLQERIRELVPGDRFEDLQIPLHVATTNLNNGRCVIFTSGPLSPTIMASSAIPLLFKPVEIEEELYVDGGVVNNLPVEAVRGRADYVIGINVMPDVVLEKKSLGNVLQIGTRAFELAIVANARLRKKQVDVLIEPPEVRNFTLFNLNRYEELHRLGYEAAQAVMGEIRKGIKGSV